MTGLQTKEKEIVVPGEILAMGMDYLPGNGAYREGEKVIAGRLGLVQLDGRAIKLISLSGKYMPKSGDNIICRVFEVGLFGWRLDTNSAYSAMLPIKDATSEFINRGTDLSQFFDVGDYMIGKIVNVTSQKLIDISLKGPGLRKLKGGRIIEANTNKVPRIIGKQGSMVSMIKNATGCRIVVGQNGLIWIDGEPKNELIAIQAIKKIENESHVAGLTEKIKEFLEKQTGNKLEVPTADREDR